MKREYRWIRWPNGWQPAELIYHTETDIEVVLPDGSGDQRWLDQLIERDGVRLGPTFEEPKEET